MVKTSKVISHFMGKSAPVTPSAVFMDHGGIHGAILGTAARLDLGDTAAAHHAQGMVTKARDVGLAKVLVKEFAIIIKIRAPGTQNFVTNFWANFTFFVVVSKMHKCYFD